MINWKTLGELITLKEVLYRLYDILSPEESKKYRDLIQEFSDRLYNHIRVVYRQYELNVKIEEEKEKCL